MPALETLVSFVNSWECDENAHLNVQFYFAHFETANLHLRAIAGLAPELSHAVRHVRYHAELREGDIVTIESGFVLDGPLAPAVVHTLIDVSSDRIAATAWDSYPAAASKILLDCARGCSGGVEVEAKTYGPRGITKPAPHAVTRDALLSKGGFVTSRGVINPADTDANGYALDRALVGHFSDGASAVWEGVGLTKSMINELGHGRVAVEMRLACVDRLQFGELVEQISGLVDVSERRLWMRHHLFEVPTGRLVAIGDAISLAMDLTARKAARFPEDVVAGAPLLDEAVT